MCGEPLESRTQGDEKGFSTSSGGEKGQGSGPEKDKVGQLLMSEMLPPGVIGRARRELRKFPNALTRRLAAAGYKIERRYVNLPTIAECWRAIERNEPIWVYQCWVITRKTRQRARKCAQAPTD